MSLILIDIVPPSVSLLLAIFLIFVTTIWAAPPNQVSDPSSSTLAYTAGVGVVSALLLLSLMGNVVYTIAMCALLRKKMKYHYEFKK